MKNLSIKDIIRFRGKSDVSKKYFASNIKIDIEKNSVGDGGNYWITSLSAISNSYKLNDLQFIHEKKYELEAKLENTEYKRTKTMYERNIAILYKYEDYDFRKLQPSGEIKFIKKHNIDSILTIKGLQIKATPTHVITFQNNDIKEVGAIWFIAQLDGYRQDELGMFTDILFRYLEKNYSKKYNINTQYCIAVDVINNFDVSYLKLQNGEIPSILDKTLDELTKLM